MRKNRCDRPGQVQIDTSIQACVVTTASRRPPSLPRRPPISHPAFDTRVAHNNGLDLRWNRFYLHPAWLLQRETSFLKLFSSFKGPLSPASALPVSCSAVRHQRCASSSYRYRRVERSCTRTA